MLQSIAANWCLLTTPSFSSSGTRQIIEAWRQEYNESRPHRTLAERTPNEIGSEFAASRELIGQQTAEDSLSG
ncbi:MAG: integrase core domain-containing protein [Candidatus Acidiferrales bacterium]